MTKKELSFTISVIVTIVVILFVIVMIRTWSLNNTEQRNVNEKVKLLSDYVPKGWKCIGASGGFDSTTGRYEYDFTYTVGGVAAHYLFAYSDYEDLTEATVWKMQQIDENGFVVDWKR